MKPVKLNILFVFGVAYISLCAGVGLESVGHISTTAGTPYPWYMPLLTTTSVALPFIMGVLSQIKED